MKKFMAIVLSCTLLMTALAGFAMTASAAGVVPITFTAQSVTAKAGDTITVDIAVSENHYMVNGQIWIQYDPEMLEIQAVSDDPDYMYFEDINTKIIKSNYMWQFAVPEAGTAKFAFASSASAGSAVGGTIFTLTFKVLEDATTSEIVVLVPDGDMNANDGSVEGGADADVELTYVNGVITVESDAPAVTIGDINGDGLINLNDATSLFYHVNGLALLEGDALAAGDINVDDVVNLNDATALFYQINGLV